MHCYTRDELADLLGVASSGFADVVTEMPHRQGMPPVFKLRTPIDVGEKRKATYVINVIDRGWALFPTLASAKLWNQERAQWVAA